MMVTVMGSEGIARGAAVFRSMKAYQAVMSGNPPRGVTFVNFERLAKVPHTLAAEADEHGRTVVNKSAFPMLTTASGSKLSGRDGNDLHRATAALDAVVAVVESQHAKSGDR